MSETCDFTGGSISFDYVWLAVLRRIKRDIFEDVKVLWERAKR